MRGHGLGQQLLGDLQVLVERYGGAVPHVRLEERRLTARDPLDGDVEQRPDEAVELVLGAVVGVQRDVDRVVLRDLGGVRRERDRAGDHVLDRRAGEVLRTAGRDLDDAVGARLGEALERGVQGLRRRDVDGRERERARLGGVQHLGVLLGGGDGHGRSSSGGVGRLSPTLVATHRSAGAAVVTSDTSPSLTTDRRRPAYPSHGHRPPRRARPLLRRRPADRRPRGAARRPGHRALRRRRRRCRQQSLLRVAGRPRLVVRRRPPTGPPGDTGSQIAVEPTAHRPPAADRKATSEVTDAPRWQDGEVVRYVDGELEVRPGAVVHEQIDNPQGYAAPDLSDALDLTLDGHRMWVLAERSDGSTTIGSSTPSNGWASFADWVADQVAVSQGGSGGSGWPVTVRLAGDGRVVAAGDNTISQRTDHPRLGDTFAAPGTPTGAAVVQVDGGPLSLFVVWRVVDGQLDVITTPPRDLVGRDLRGDARIRASGVRLGRGPAVNQAVRDREFSEFVAARRTHLRRIAYAICGDWHRADDLVQTALIKLYVAWPRLHRDGRRGGLRPHDHRPRQHRRAPPGVAPRGRRAAARGGAGIASHCRSRSGPRSSRRSRRLPTDAAQGRGAPALARAVGRRDRPRAADQPGHGEEPQLARPRVAARGARRPRAARAAVAALTTR